VAKLKISIFIILLFFINFKTAQASSTIENNFTKAHEFKAWTIYKSPLNEYLALIELENDLFFGFTCIIKKCSFFTASQKDNSHRSYGIYIDPIHVMVENNKKIERYINLSSLAQSKKNEKFNLYLIPTSKLLTSKLMSASNMLLFNLDLYRHFSHRKTLSGSTASILYVIEKSGLVDDNYYSSDSTRIFNDENIENLEFGDPKRAYFKYEDAELLATEARVLQGEIEASSEISNKGIVAKVVYSYEYGAYITTKNSDKKLLIEFDENPNNMDCYAENRFQSGWCNSFRVTWEKASSKRLEKRVSDAIKANKDYQASYEILLNGFSSTLRAYDILEISPLMLYQNHNKVLRQIRNELSWR